MMETPVAPAGDVTLMFTDIEGSTRAWQTYGDRFHAALLRHNALIRQAISAHRGYEVKTIGDAFMAAFARPLDGALCALKIQHSIEAEPFEEVGGMRVRIGLHAGTIEPIGGDYFGNAVNRAAHIENAGRGGMILLSEEMAQRIKNALPEGASLIDQGMHRLKDLSDLQNLFQLTHRDLPQRSYPALRTLAPSAHNFPAQLTSFVGREREIRELTGLLNDPDQRLITITGPGGTGKTRLSLQVAAECVPQYDQGVWLVELANVMRAQDVPAAVALALEIPLNQEGDVRAQTLAYLRERRCLLALDNFEQVIDAARFVSELLKTCPRVTVLISSRELLQIAGEQEYLLAPLELPTASVNLKTWTQYASLRLFVERCQSARPNFTVTESNVEDISEICRRLEGLPLAVELTSALTRGMTPQQIMPRLKNRLHLLASARRDLDPRQRSMRGAFDWSYDLLSEDERALFAELAVFAGSFSLEAAEAVCATPGVFTLIYALRDKSLLRSVNADYSRDDGAKGDLADNSEDISEEDSEANPEGGARFAMLETLREYANEKRAASGESGLNARHAGYYLNLAQQWSEKLEGSGDAMRAQQRFQTDIDNMRAGMDWAAHQADSELVTAYGRALARFFLARGLYSEGNQRLATAEEACRRGGSLGALALILLQRGRIAFRQSHMCGSETIL